eukprot:COSAG04_NODE_8038_length_1031_cov_1.181330_1_plen_31_part_10
MEVCCPWGLAMWSRYEFRVSVGEAEYARCCS